MILDSKEIQEHANLNNYIEMLDTTRMSVCVNLNPPV